MSKSTKTKNVTQTREFLTAAAGHEEDALAFVIMACLGISMTVCLSNVTSALNARDYKVLVLMVAAAGQIRENVVFVGDDYADMKAKYPSLMIEGTREQKDKFNFSALHICGHILCMITTDPLGKLILAKAGNCVGGGGFTDNEAGKINQEIYKKWSREDHDALDEVTEDEAWSNALDPMFEALPGRQKAFQTTLEGIGRTAAKQEVPAKPSITTGATVAEPRPAPAAPIAPKI
jgi:hypothetical protein